MSRPTAKPFLLPCDCRLPACCDGASSLCGTRPDSSTLCWFSPVPKKRCAIKWVMTKAWNLAMIACETAADEANLQRCSKMGEPTTRRAVEKDIEQALAWF